MRIGEICIRDVVCADRSTSVQDAVSSSQLYFPNSARTRITDLYKNVPEAC